MAKNLNPQYSARRHVPSTAHVTADHSLIHVFSAYIARSLGSRVESALGSVVACVLVVLTMTVGFRQCVGKAEASSILQRV